jgi:DNA-binding transcriptional LysR family regulator
MRSHYETFLQIVESGSISKACAKLNISQPALSKQLRRLEDELKVQLFERSPNGVKLTAYGDALIVPARMMRDADHAAQMIVERLRQSVSGHVAFGVSAPLALNIVPRVILELLALAPGLEVEVVDDRAETLLGMVQRSEIEFCVCSNYHDGFPDEFTVYDIFEDIAFIVASPSHEIFGNARMEAQYLPHQHWVGSVRALETRIGPKFRDLGIIVPRIRVETLSMAQTVNLVESGRFLALLPSITIRPQLADSSLLPILPEVFSTRFNFKAVTRRGVPLSRGGKIIVDTFLSVSRNM